MSVPVAYFFLPFSFVSQLPSTFWIVCGYENRIEENRILDSRFLVLHTFSPPRSAVIMAHRKLRVVCRASDWKSEGDRQITWRQRRREKMFEEWKKWNFQVVERILGTQHCLSSTPTTMSTASTMELDSAAKNSTSDMNENNAKSHIFCVIRRVWQVSIWCMFANGKISISRIVNTARISIPSLEARPPTV